MVRAGDVVEFRAGTWGLQAPKNLGILVDRYRTKGVPWVRVMTIDGPKEGKAEHLTKRTFRQGYEGDIRDEAAVGARLRMLLDQHAKGALAEEGEDDLQKLEMELWEASCDDARESWSEDELAVRLYGADASPLQRKQVRETLGRCRRMGTGRFQTAGRGDQWRPWRRSEMEAIRKAWRELDTLRGKMVHADETDDGRVFRAVHASDMQLSETDHLTLAWVKAAMEQFVEHDGVPQGGQTVAGIGGLAAVQVEGMDLHRRLGFLAQDWAAPEPTSTSSHYILFLLKAALWTPEAAVASLIRRHVNQEPFFEHSKDVPIEALADALPEPALEQDPDRSDLRHLPCYTIDPVDAKDFDDAVGLETRPDGGDRLWVHVADVSQYVALDSKLDRYARDRATSVYLPGRVLPMLPHRISDHLCSLRDDGDRFALSVGMDLDRDGRVIGCQFHKAIIRVTKNLSYGAALERAKAGEQPFARLLDVASRMRQHRRGLELETGELKVLLGAEGFSALEKRADEATRMIETFMVAANEAVAKHLADANVPQLFRCHPLPDPQKAEKVSHQLETMGFPAKLELPRKPPAKAAAAQTLLDQLKAGGGKGKLNLFGGGIAIAGPPTTAPVEPEPIQVPGFAQLAPVEQDAWLRPFKAILDVLADHRDRELAEVATIKLLGCMGRAHYSPDNEGHFGLASTHYCHFTSPIRRYPDLVVHRNLKWLLAGRKGPVPHSQESLRTMCDHCSNQEGAAAGLERRIKASCLVLATLGLGEASATAMSRVTGITPVSLFVVREDGLEARAWTRDLPGAPYQVDEWEAMLFHEGEAGARPGPRDWEDPETGEVRRVRLRLGDRVQTRLTARDVAAGRTGATLAS